VTDNSIARAITVILTVCALVVTGLLVRREVFHADTPTAPTTIAPTVLENWEDILEGGSWLGSRDASVRAAMFIDFRCAFCSQAASIIDELRLEFPDELAISIRHLPNTFDDGTSTRLAVGAVCASNHGRFEEFSTLAYETTGDFREDAAVDLAIEAGVSDQERFRECLSSGGSLRQVLDDQRIAIDNEVRGTPTFLLDGVLYHGMSGLTVIEERLRTLAD
jgi:protein-disulfide isomerase